MIVAEGLAKVFFDPKRGEFRAVDGVSFTCRPGRIFGLLGPNGAGKTTTLRILSTSLVPTAGRALVDGFDVVREPGRARARLGFCTGATGIYERLSPREMIEYFGRLYGLEGEALAARTEELLSLFGLGPYAEIACGKLSAGNRQKVSLARTIVHEPPVLVFDEPTTSLDILVARTVTEFIARCREQGRTVILSTHIMSEVERLCDDVAILHEGRILVQGPVEELKARSGAASIEDLFFDLVDRTAAAGPGGAMRSRTVRLIAAKELRDTLRDRRTLFVALLLPLLLYPALLLGLTQVIGATQRNLEREEQKVLVDGLTPDLEDLLRQQSLRVLEPGSGDLPADLADTLRDKAAAVEGKEEADASRKALRRTLRDHELSGAVLGAPEFAERTAAGRRAEAMLLFDPTDEPSRTVARKAARALRHFASLRREALRARFPAETERLRFAEEPVQVDELETASPAEKGAYSFAPLLGLLVVLMALTGAFYPAVDLAAGEKERGTLETLLVAPVARREIVLGKFLAIWVIAVITALANLFVMGVTFSKVAGMIGSGQVAFHLSPLAAATVTLILVPTAALFGAVALALSSFATSYKEGQHYLSPLFLVATPLAMVALLPNIEIGYVLALVPVSNVVLLVKTMLLGGEAAGPALVAAGATAAYAAAALWVAVALFRRESVLFRSGAGRGFDPASLQAARARLPAPGTALLLYFAVLALMFFLSGGAPETPAQAVLMFLRAQLLAVLAPTLLFAWKARVDLRRTFRLLPAAPRFVPAALVAAAATVVLVGALYQRFLPEPEVAEGFRRIVELLHALPFWAYLALLAVLPPVTEELLCRGFLLSAFQPRYGSARAVVLVAALFAVLHLDFPRFPATFLAGLVSGYLCVRTGSILMAILFHMAYNAVIATPELAILIRSEWTQIGGAALVLLACVAFLERQARSSRGPDPSPAPPSPSVAPDREPVDAARRV